MFRIDSKFFVVLSRLADLVILNILFWVCCIPIVTIGASITAMYAVTKKMAEDREGYIFKGFFIAFKENFRQSTIMWMILLVPIAIVSADLYISNWIREGLAQTFFKGFLLLAWMLIMFVMIYAFALQSTFENTIKNTLKNALLISLAHTPRSLAMTFLALSPFIALLYFGEYFGMELLLIILIWFSGTAYLNSLILNKIFKKYM